MYFRTTHQPENFRFPAAKACEGPAWSLDQDRFESSWTPLGEDVYRLCIDAERWPVQHSQAELSLAFDGANAAEAGFTPKTGLTVKSPKGGVLLKSRKGRSFGVSGQAWLMQFEYDPAMRFYGLGEKSFGLEHTGRSTKFWNTDVWADFAGDTFTHGEPDPMYLSIPYLILKQDNDYVGVLVNNPDAVFMSMNPKPRIAEQADAAGDAEDTRFFIGAPDGKPELFIMVGPTLPELTRKLQRLVGKTPLPPLWALGHHQCRWGYAGYEDLDELDEQFRRHKIPNDGLWLDIDYMVGYRVFTWDKQHWPKPAKDIENLQKRGQHVVPIFDPGVKVDPDYRAYRLGLRARAFCQNPAGTPFVGFVWPGQTVFPDFSIERGRSWWSKQVAEAAGTGITGAWLDMNDPATGLSENSEMRFDDGKLAHATYHNQYALGMAKATHDGLLLTHPDRRPFLLTRSGYTSINRYAAAWTGDNISNTHHLKNSIPMTLNLALSGLPFNGPDVPGFGGEPTKELAIAWYKACFLFPFLRNHSNKASPRQEPWAFGAVVMKVIRRYIRLRYKLLPYLYNLFVNQEETGEAILRPLFYDFEDSVKLPLDRVDDQFMVGPSIMQAPVLDPESLQREVVLPFGRWYDAIDGRWVVGGNRKAVKVLDSGATPLYFRDGAVVAMRPGDPEDNATDLRDIDLHVFVSKSFKGKASCVYVADDGTSFGYRRGERTAMHITVTRDDDQLNLLARKLLSGYGEVKFRVIDHGGCKSVTTEGVEQPATLKLKPMKLTLTGEKLSVGASAVSVV
ncbi:MAG: TIM-barrel domain-containing protein [Planctomycetota bacterium]